MKDNMSFNILKTTINQTLIELRCSIRAFVFILF